MNRNLARLATAAGAGALVLLAGAPGASASQYAGLKLTPGQQVCVQQYASYQMRAQGTATGQGAKFKVLRNGVAISGIGSPGLVTGWAAELRTSFGTFPGPGTYTACATNNGTANTNVTLQLFTDSEV